MSRSRLAGRNVTFYDAGQPEVAIGGLVQNGSITEENFLDILGILLVIKRGPLHVQERGSNHIVSRTQTPLATGAYDISCPSSIQVTDEPCYLSVISHAESNREQEFRIAIRARDRKCVLSGMESPEALIAVDNWHGFEAAHIIPLRLERLWVSMDYGRWVRETDDEVVSSKINSPQNGFLIQRSIHRYFDQHLISVNPDDGYKVVMFTVNMMECDGRILDAACRNKNHPHHVSDPILRWHFRQSVLANMRGAGEPIFGLDLPPEPDTQGKVVAGLEFDTRSELLMATGLSEVA